MLLIFAHWVHDLDPVIFQFSESIAIRWYGVAYILGFLSAFLLFRWYHKKGLSPMGPDRLETLMFAMILGVIIGGRVGYMLLYDFESFIRNPLILFQIWQGGMASHGGFAGVIIATIIVCRKWQVSALRIGDLIATVVTPGLFFGRIANFINGELWGKVSNVPWAVKFPQSTVHGTPVEWIAARHPSQLYEAVLEGLLLFILFQIRLWKTSARLYPGRIAGEFIILYGIVRTLGEFFREPDADLILGLSRGSFYSIIFMGVGIALIILSKRLGPQKKSVDEKD